VSRASSRRILVLGCGALGGALIDRFSRYADITVVDPSPRAKIKKHIFQSANALKAMSFDGLIVATKCYDIEKALRPLKNCVSIRRILFLQNGILNLSGIPRLFPQAGIVRGVTTSAVGISSRRAVFYYQGDFFLAPEDNKKNEAVGWFGRLFADAGLTTSLVSKSSRIIWAKLIFSAVMNPLPVMTRQGYDILSKDQEVWKLVQQAVEEGKAVARSLGVRLAFDPLKLIQRVRDGDLKGISHRGSIFQDMNSGRLTELDFITGALVREARKAGVRTPALNLILLRAKAAGA
jgi:2-dehydropantoate 2-reductase